jgi:hypothetical protein
MLRKFLLGVVIIAGPTLGAAAETEGTDPAPPKTPYAPIPGSPELGSRASWLAKSPYASVPSDSAANVPSDGPAADVLKETPRLDSATNFSTGGCGPDGRFWASAELLLWWTRPQHVPVLLTSGTSAANPGVIGQPGTTVLFGGPVNDGMRVGERLRGGMWFDDCHICGVEGSFFFLGQSVDEFQHVCQPGDFTSRPFFNTAIGAQDAELLCFPGLTTGNIFIRATSEFLGADANWRRKLYCDCSTRVDLLVGFRYLHLGDDLAVQETVTNLDPASGVVGESFILSDRFNTNNNFYGGQFGFAGEFHAGRAYLDWRTLFGFGATTRVVTIAGSTTFVDAVTPLPTVTQPGGLLAQPSNIGQRTSTGFSVVPELAVNLGYQVTDHFRAFVGYTFIYWSQVARAGEQINLNIDPAQIPSRVGPGVGVNPPFIFHPNDFWAQGINLGLEFRY